MTHAFYRVPEPNNESPKGYAPNSIEQALLKQELTRQSNEPVEIPLIINGQAVHSGQTQDIGCPHDHTLRLGRYHKASGEHVQQAVEAARSAWPSWSKASFEERASVFLKAADLLSQKYRYLLNAATMLGQSKNVHQAEIDSACELIDFWRYNPSFMQRIYQEQPKNSQAGEWNTLSYRPLEGFVFAVTPFNFTAIGGNLATSPALMGNVVIWKPASSAVLSAHYVMQILKEAGLPDGVINLVPGSGSEIGPAIFEQPDFAGLHFTGSTATFNRMWSRVGENLSKGVYRAYPRLVGETGGKDFVIAHPDCHVKSLAVALFKGAFEYQGQKCSAASRAYIPLSIWPELKEKLARLAARIKVGDVAQFDTFSGAVIDEKSYRNIVDYIEHAKNASDAQVVIGGKYDSSEGWFVWPTVIETSNPKYRSMQEEIFGPVLSVYVFADQDYAKTLKIIDETSPYALTGAVFAQDRDVIRQTTQALEHAAGNFYINDKPTGAVVGQQPFGGGRASGTNDKAGSLLNLLRWTSPRTIKENFAPPENLEYEQLLDEQDASDDASQNKRITLHPAA